MTSTENTDQHTSDKRIADNDIDTDRSELVAPCKLKSQGLHVLVLEVEGRIEEKLKKASAKTSEATVTAKLNASTSQGSLEKKSHIMQLFRMDLRHWYWKKAPMSIISPTTALPIPSEPMNETIGANSPLRPSPPKPSPEKPIPFKNGAFGKSCKLVTLEAFGSSNYVKVPSPIVGTSRRGKTIKGKMQPPICKEGDLIKEGQLIGFLDLEQRFCVKKHGLGAICYGMTLHSSDLISYSGLNYQPIEHLTSFRVMASL
ncbi:hypothetical protein V6N13_091281 [Hibiscus sabdariffa]